MNIQTIKNVSDCVPLYLPHSLYLKPLAKFKVSVSLPQATTGKAISNWDVMEKMRQMILPEKFSVLKVSKSTLDIIQFEAELEDFAKLREVISRLDGRTLKLASFTEPVKISASQAKDGFPTRHDWDSYFRDMDEKKPGERPDTIHISNLPIRWFCPRHQENDDIVKPSESIFKRIFEKFGEVRLVDIPLCDPYRKKMKSDVSGMTTFSFDQELYFEGYIQFTKYLDFVKAMDEFRGMKLVRKEGDKNLAVNIAVDFDRSKHLSDASVKRRTIVREKFIAKDRAKKEDEKRKSQLEEEKKERERRHLEEQRMAELDKQRQREEQRKEKHMKKLREKEQQEMSSKIRSEEKKLLIAQRKLESIRVLEALFDRIKLNASHKIKVEGSKLPKHKAGQLGAIDLRNKLMNRYKSTQEIELERQMNRVKKVRSSGILGLALKGSRSRSPSVNTISSDDSIFNSNPKKKKKKKAKKNQGESSTSSSSEDETAKPPAAMIPPPGAFPMFNPETGQWMGMSMGMGMYPYPPFLAPMSAPMVRPEYFQNPMSYRGYRGGPRGRYPRSRGRGSYRGRGGHQYDGDYKYENDGYDDDHDHRRSKYSRSRSRSRSRSLSRSRSSRSRSRSRRSRSRSRSRSKSKTKKLVSTLRKSKSSSRDRWSSRSRSKSRSKSRRSKRSRSWSRDASSRSRSRSKRRPSHKRTSESAKRIVLQPEKLVRSAKEIQRTVQQKLHEQVLEEERVKQMEKNQDYQRITERPQLIPVTAKNAGGTTPPLYQRTSRSRTKSPKTSRSKSRSPSIKSAEFVSPKRRNHSTSL